MSPPPRFARSLDTSFESSACGPPLKCATCSIANTTTTGLERPMGITETEALMSSATRIEPVSEVETPEPTRTSPNVDKIRVAVLRALGRPPEMIRVSVLPLWGDKFRVNVWATGSNGAAIPNSYFVTADEQGAILKSEPPIQKLY